MGRGTRALRLQGRGRFEGVGSSLGAWEHMRAAHSVKRLAPSKQAIVGSARAVAVHATRSRASSRTRLRASSHFVAACSRSSTSLHGPCPGTNQRTTERTTDRPSERMNERTNERINKRAKTNERTNKQTTKQTNERTIDRLCAWLNNE